MTTEEAAAIISRQCEEWELCRRNYAALAGVESRPVLDEKGSVITTLLHNPARIHSSAAPAATERRCFLCRDNRPAEQSFIVSGDYEILVNPFPIFPIHFTISSLRHEPQSISGHIRNMLGFADLFPTLTVFYNGPKCGASAPDHHHFQAADFSLLHPESQGLVTPSDHSIEIASTDDEEIAAIFSRLMLLLPGDEPEPMINLLLDRLPDGRKCLCVIPRRRHRPACYGDIIVSPAAVEMAGYMVTPRREDFERIDTALAREILDQVTYSPLEINRLCNLL